jgi:hypothetical protein
LKIAPKEYSQSHYFDQSVMRFKISPKINGKLCFLRIGKLSSLFCWVFRGSVPRFFYCRCGFHVRKKMFGFVT